MPGIGLQASALDLRTTIVSEISSNYYNHYGLLQSGQMELVLSAVETLIDTAPAGSSAHSRGGAAPARAPRTLPRTEL